MSVRSKRERRGNIRRAAFVASVAWLLVCGCENRSADEDRFIPSPAIAREALDSALGGWRTGQAPARVEGGSRTIQSGDTHRLPGQTLAKYEVLGELAVDRGRRFSVRLHLEGPTAVEKAQFVVIGIDPVWVLRQEDYDMLAHWDHPMPTTEEQPPPTAETPGPDAPAASSPSAP